MKKYDIPVPFLEKKVKQKSKGTHNESLVKYPDEPNIFDDTKAEVDALANEFKNARQKEKDRKEQNTNAAFWFAVYFQDEDQKNEFFEKAGIDKTMTAGQYIDGITFAKQIGIEIVKKELKPPGKFKTIKL